MQRILSLVLALATLLGVLLVAVSCGSTQDPGTDGKETKAESATAPDTKETEEETEEPRIKPDIPETYDFGGEVYRVGGWSVSGWDEMARGIRDVVATDYNADVVNDAVFERNTAIQDNYKITIEFERIEYVSFRDKLIRDAQVGDAEWNVVYPLMSTLGGLVLNNALANIATAPYVDLKQPWYDKSCLDYLGIGGAVFAVSTAASINDKDGTAALAFNKAAAQDNNLPNLYEIVAGGGWTIEVLDDCCRDVLADLNGDQVYDANDFYGFLGKMDVAPSFKDGFESMIITKDSDGMYQFSLGTEYDIEVSEVILEFMSEDYFFNQHLIGIGDDEFTQKFGRGEGLFFWMRMDEVTNLRAAETDFGILPIPKYDDTQDYYHSYVSKNTSSLLSIPFAVTGEKLELTGMILEALSADSMYTLQPAYIDQALKTKYARDEESRDMITLVMAHRVWDPGMVYGFGGISDTYLYLYNQKRSLATIVAEMTNQINKDIEKFNLTVETALD